MTKKDDKKEESKEEIIDDEVKPEEPEINKEEETQNGVEDIKDSLKEELTENTPALDPPPKPIRPLSPKSQAKKSLAEAFPTIQEPYITAVLISSNYNLEPAFNALLYISDPSVNPEELTAAAYPPVSANAPRRQKQLEQDELLAKQLVKEFNRKERRRQRFENERRKASQQDEEDENFFDTFVEKDLPEIKAQFSKNIEETKNKFNSWVSGWKTNFNNSQDQLSQPQKKQNLRFDEDPEEVDLRKFHGIQLNDDDNNKSTPRPKLPNRDRTNSTDLYGTPKTKKWEPLKSTNPQPKVDDDDFLLSDEETKK